MMWQSQFWLVLIVLLPLLRGKNKTNPKDKRVRVLIDSHSILQLTTTTMIFGQF
jgi:hypothetical protein